MVVRVLSDGENPLEQFVRTYEVTEVKEYISHDDPGVGAHRTSELGRTSHGHYSNRDLALSVVEDLKAQRIRENPDLRYDKMWIGLIPSDVDYRIKFLVEPQLIALEDLELENISEK